MPANKVDYAPLTAAFTVSAAVVFLLSAGLGVVVAYDHVAAFDRFVLLVLPILLLLPISWLARRDPAGWVPGLLAVGSAWVGGLLALYFLFAFDWNSNEIQQTWMRQVGAGIARLRPAVGLSDAINPNVAAGGLIVLILVGLGGLVWLARQEAQPRAVWRWLLGVPAGIGVVLASVTLVLTDSRGAWLAMLVGLPVFGYARWRSGPGRDSTLRHVGDIVAGVAAGLLAAAIAFVLVAPAQVGALIHAAAGPSAFGRAQLWPDAAALIDDYRFTGSGLGETMMVYATYYLLLHVGYTPHMHSLYLQVAVEQGIPGLVAFLCLVAGTAAILLLALGRGTPGRRDLAAGSLAALVALLVHGFFDAGLYASRLAPLLFVPLWVAWPLRPRRHKDDPIHWGGLTLLGAALPPALAVLVFLLPGSRAAFQANLGAVEQSIAELAVYAWPAWPLQDELRRTGAVELAPAQARYMAALALDPNNVTAQARLGQIALAQGDLEGARSHLEAAYARAPARRAVRQLLGEVYARQGDPAKAVELWRGLDFSAGQLELRRWWVEHAGTPEEAQRLEAAINALGKGQ